MSFPGHWFDVLFSNVCYRSLSWNLLPSMGMHIYLRLHNPVLPVISKVLLLVYVQFAAAPVAFTVTEEEAHDFY